MKGKIFDIIRNSFVDGAGIRTTVFFKGCNMRCEWCHNPESQSFKTELLFYKNKCVNCGKCKSVCPNELTKCDLCGKCEIYCPKDARKICGYEISTKNLLEIITKDIEFYNQSGGGVTFSGGECMLQVDFLVDVLKACKELGINTAIDTAGNVPYSSFESVLPYTDTFLYDIKAISPLIHKKFTGVDNYLILENLKKLSKTNKNIVIRIPVICGVNDNEVEIRKISNYLNKLGIKEVELLPYHPMGESKREALGLEKKVFSTPTTEKMKLLSEIVKNKAN